MLRVSCSSSKQMIHTAARILYLPDSFIFNEMIGTWCDSVFSRWIQRRDSTSRRGFNEVVLIERSNAHRIATYLPRWCIWCDSVSTESFRQIQRADLDNNAANDESMYSFRQIQRAGTDNAMTNPRKASDRFNVWLRVVVLMERSQQIQRDDTDSAILRIHR